VETPKEHWEHFPHGADIGVRGVATSLAGAFGQAALALTAIVADPKSFDGNDVVEVACETPDPELLLIDWLNALIFEMATRRLLFGRFEVELQGTRLRAKAWGQAMDSEGIELAVEPKGATYTALSVQQMSDGSWAAQCVVDV